MVMDSGKPVNPALSRQGRDMLMNWRGGGVPVLAVEKNEGQRADV